MLERGESGFHLRDANDTGLSRIYLSNKESTVQVAEMITRSGEGVSNW